MDIDLRRFQETFFEEATDHVASLEAGLLQLEAEGPETELLNTIFRAAHSIKGGAGSFGFTEVARFTHVLENVLDRLRSGRLAVSADLTRLLLRSADVLGSLVEATRAGDASKIERADLEHALEDMLEPARATVAGSPTAGARPASGPRRVTVKFEPDERFYLQGQDPLLLLDELARTGTDVEIACDVSAVPDLEDLDPEACHLCWTVVLTTAATEVSLREVFLFVEDACHLEIADESPAATASAGSAPSVATGGAGAATGPDRRGAGPDRRADTSTLKVPIAKVDALINLVGELVISQAMVMQSWARDDTAGFAEALSVVQRSTRELQEHVMGIRMLPVGSVFHRFPRLVRDLGDQLGKRVRLDIAGAETELDKSVLEQLGDPLTHLIRNSVDHGVESPEAREAAGKPAEGVVTLRAFHEGGNVVIEILDDGKGLDADRIRAKAVEKGIVRPDEVLSETQVVDLVFAAGFSTAAVVSDVSGRGVGMDVVRRNVEALNGSITVQTKAGEGTRFRIRLPLTLAILDGLATRTGGQTYILPLLSVRQSIVPRPGDIRTVLGGQGEVFLLRGAQLPIVRLADVFGVARAERDPLKAIVVVAENDGEAFGLMVDDVIGQQQVVVKNLEKNWKRVESVMGATILGDGRVAFIVDVSELHRVAMRRGGSGERQTTVADGGLAVMEEAA